MADVAVRPTAAATAAPRRAPTYERRLGVYLGAYGYLETGDPASGGRRPVADDTLPAEVLQGGAGDLVEQVGNGGYVHAPSLNHAAAAAPCAAAT